MRAALVALFLFLSSATAQAWGPIDDQILYTCNEAGHDKVPFRIAERLFERESNWNPLAVNNRTDPPSLGLGQILETNLVAFEVYNSGRPIDWRNPFINAKVSIRYLADLHHRYAGPDDRSSWLLALMAYNEGMYWVDRGIYFPESIDYATWILGG